MITQRAERTRTFWAEEMLSHPMCPGLILPFAPWSLASWGAGCAFPVLDTQGPSGWLGRHLGQSQELPVSLERPLRHVGPTLGVDAARVQRHHCPEPGRGLPPHPTGSLGLAGVRLVP